MFFFSISKESNQQVLFYKRNLKSFDKTALKICIFIRKLLKTLLPSVFSSWSKFSFESLSHYTRWEKFRCLQITFCQTKTYGRYSAIINAIYV